MNVVNRILNRKSETKYAGQLGAATWTNITSQLDGTINQIRRVIPPVVQGSDENDRLGDSLVPTSLKVKLALRLAAKPTGAEPPFAAPGARDITAVIWYGYARKYKASDVLFSDTNIIRSLLDNGTATGVPFLGNPQELLFPVKNEFFQVKRKTVRLHKPTGTVNIFGQDDGTAGGLDASMLKYVSLDFKTPAKFLYGDAAKAYPENYAPFFAVAYVNNDPLSEVSSQAGTGSLEIHWNKELYFKDM